MQSGETMMNPVNLTVQKDMHKCLERHVAFGHRAYVFAAK